MFWHHLGWLESKPAVKIEALPYGDSHLFHGDCKDIRQVNANYSAMHLPKKLLNDSRILKNTEGNHHGTISEKYSLIPWLICKVILIIPQ